MKNKKEEIPECPFGHTDDIIPISYGLPDNDYYREMTKNETVHFAGCHCHNRVTGKRINKDGSISYLCESLDPKWYCKRHRIMF